jgi:predicted O-linked N-acetylglucosamine transferase (SPINDLY family)
MKSGSLKRTINLPDQMQIGVMLQTIHEKMGDNEKSLNILHAMLHMLQSHSSSTIDPFYVLWFKQISLSLANVQGDPQQCFTHLLHAISTECVPEYNSPEISAINKNLRHKMFIQMHYADHSLFQNAANTMDTKTFKTIQSATEKTYAGYIIPKFPLPKNNGKINIGYLSPDFNKNAVGLFLTCFLKHYDPSHFNVFVYYTNHQSDEFTTQFKSYPVTWIDAAYMDDSALYNLIKFTHRIDVLVDLISAGVSNRLELMCMSPANVIINYLGYPGTSFIPQVTHKLADGISDPLESHNTHYTETLVKMPRCFLCFSLFDNLQNLPQINPTFDSGDTIYAGVMNKSLKFHPNILKTWKEILLHNKNLVLCIKEDEYSSSSNSIVQQFMNSVPPNQIKIIPFQPSLPEYLSVFNQFHFCLDTFPYSGTTTTCTSLYMGVPVFTVYNPNNMHVSNVSASIITGTDPALAKRFVCNDLDDYVSRVNGYCSLLTDNTEYSWNKSWRQDLQSKFLQLMEPRRFMHEYESVIKSLL